MAIGPHTYDRLASLPAGELKLLIESVQLDVSVFEANLKAASRKSRFYDLAKGQLDAAQATLSLLRKTPEYSAKLRQIALETRRIINDVYGGPERPTGAGFDIFSHIDFDAQNQSQSAHEFGAPTPKPDNIFSHIPEDFGGF